MTAIINDELSGATKKTPKYTIAGCISPGCRAASVYAKCVDVYDGDTAQFVFRTSPGQPLYRHSCRMIGYNSAEIRGGSEAEKKQAQVAKQALSEQILGKVVVLNVGESDKYGRPLVAVICDGRDINTWMMEHGYGQPYTGQGEKKW